MDLAPLEIALGHVFTCPDLLMQALTHSSARGKNNQRLEFLGDAVLEIVISEVLFHRDPELDEGQLTFLRTKLVREDCLSRIANSLELWKYLVLAKGADQSIKHRTSVLADAMEAVLAAVYLDGGSAAVAEVIRILWATEMDTGDVAIDSKSALQMFLQARGEAVPVYETLNAEGPAHKRSFTVAVLHHGSELARGTGKTKKQAEQEAAKVALCLLSNAED